MPLAVRTLSWRHCFVPTLTAALVNCDPREPSTEAPPEGSVDHPPVPPPLVHCCLPACLLLFGLWANPNQEKSRRAAPATSTATMRYGRWGSFSRGLPHQKIWHNPLVLLELPTHSRAHGHRLTACKFTIGHPPDHPSPAYIYI
jgi:hypothetical protein